MMSRVLVAEPSAPVAQALGRVLEQRGYEVTLTDSCESACRHVGPYDCAVLSVSLPDGNGISLAGWLLAEERVHEVVFFDELLDTDQMERASNLGVVIGRGEGIQALCDAVQEVVGPSRERAVAVGAERPTTGRTELKSGRRPKRPS